MNLVFIGMRVAQTIETIAPTDIGKEKDYISRFLVERRLIS